jgi:ATP-dependent Clp protease ATP-binding subunit ClpC
MSDRPFTTRAQRTLLLADREAAKLQHEYIGTEHLLLGLLAEETGLAAQILWRAGITAEQVHELLRQSQAPSAG